MRPILITIRYSHYCEKARWALEHHGIAYTEEQHVPVLAWKATFGSGAGRTVPVLVAGETVLPDSTDVLRWADAHGQGGGLLLPPGDEEVASLEDRFDEKLGPATRRLAYFHLLRDPKFRDLLVAGEIPSWEKKTGRAFGAVIASLIRVGLKVNESGVERSKMRIDEIFDDVARRLSDGRPYLTGDRFTGADLAFATLAGPVLFPPSYQRFSAPESDHPPSLRPIIDHYRETPAGRFAMRLCAAPRCTDGASQARA